MIIRFEKREWNANRSQVGVKDDLKDLERRSLLGVLFASHLISVRAHLFFSRSFIVAVEN